MSSNFLVFHTSRGISSSPAAFLFLILLISLVCVLRAPGDKIKENGFKATKERSRRYSAKAITDADYADDIALLANAPPQAENLLNSLERAAAGIGLNDNAHKTYVLQSNVRHLHIKLLRSATS